MMVCTASDPERAAPLIHVFCCFAHRLRRLRRPSMCFGPVPRRQRLTVLIKRGFSYADLEARREVDIESTVFRQASISKVCVWGLYEPDLDMPAAEQIRKNIPVAVFAPGSTTACSDYGGASPYSRSRPPAARRSKSWSPSASNQPVSGSECQCSRHQLIFIPKRP